MHSAARPAGSSGPSAPSWYRAPLSICSHPESFTRARACSPAAAAPSVGTSPPGRPSDRQSGAAGDSGRRHRARRGRGFRSLATVGGVWPDLRRLTVIAVKTCPPANFDRLRFRLLRVLCVSPVSCRYRGCVHRGGGPTSAGGHRAAAYDLSRLPMTLSEHFSIRGHGRRRHRAGSVTATDGLRALRRRGRPPRRRPPASASPYHTARSLRPVLPARGRVLLAIPRTTTGVGFSRSSSRGESSRSRDAMPWRAAKKVTFKGGHVNLPPVVHDPRLRQLQPAASCSD